jgi:hypothetical protein
MDRHSSLVRFIRSEWRKRFEPQLEKIIGRFDFAKPSANFSISPGASPVTSAAASKVQGWRCSLMMLPTVVTVTWLPSRSSTSKLPSIGGSKPSTMSFP